LSVNIEANALTKPRSIHNIKSKQIGSKKSVIKIGENGGTVEHEVIDKNNYSVNDEDLLRLGDIAVQVFNFHAYKIYLIKYMYRYTRIMATLET